MGCLGGEFRDKDYGELRCCKTEKWPNVLVVPECAPRLCNMEEAAKTGLSGQAKHRSSARRQCMTDMQAGGVYVKKCPLSLHNPLKIGYYRSLSFSSAFYIIQDFCFLVGYLLGVWIWIFYILVSKVSADKFGLGCQIINKTMNFLKQSRTHKLAVFLLETHRQDAFCLC